MATEEEISELESSILQSATEGVQSVSVDTLTVNSKNLREQLEVLEHFKEEQAASQPHFGLRFTRLRPPGCG